MKTPQDIRIGILQRENTKLKNENRELKLKLDLVREWIIEFAEWAKTYVGHSYRCKIENIINDVKRDIKVRK